MRPAKLVLAVIDGCNPEMLERAIELGRAPALAAIARRGTLVRDGAASAFPSVTPVCAAAIATGSFQDGHLIAGMNWFSRERGRYVEYGSSFAASLRFGIPQQLTDTVFNLNAEHLSARVETIFETLDDARLRTVGTTYLVYRGRHRHEVSRALALSRIAGALWRRSAMGPRELYYADIFATRDTGCRSQMGMPGVRDRHAGCVAAHLVERDAFDFLLLSLPDNDKHSHRHGPGAQVDSIAEADAQLLRAMDAAGGAEPFLDDHAVIVVADHAHALVDRHLELGDLVGGRHVLPPSGRDPDAEVALCPNGRAAMIYVLAEPARRLLAPQLAETALTSEGVDLAAWLEDGEAVLASSAGSLRFAPGHPPPERAGPGDVRDARGGAWRLRGDLDVLGAEVSDGVLDAGDYPNALARVWAALSCPTSGDVLLSAAPGWEFADWGGGHHRGGGSHGSLHRTDSLGAFVHCGLEMESRALWSITDVAPAIRAHFDVA